MKKLLVLLLLMCTVALTSCHSTKVVEEIPVEIKTTESLVKIDTVYIAREVKTIDSVRVSDSISTIYKDSFIITDRWHTVYNYKYLNGRDTIYKNKLVSIHDTIEKPVYITKTKIEEVKYIPWWIKFLSYFGAVCLVIIMAYVLSIVKIK